jgi:hypothetical protein
MPAVIPDFPFLMRWLVLGMNVVAVLFFLWEATRFPSHRRCALLGCLAMIGVLIATGTALLLGYDPYTSESLGLWMLPLLSSLLLAGLSHFTFAWRRNGDE